MGRDTEDRRERSFEGCTQSSNKEGIEGVEELGDDTCPTSREPSVLGSEGRGRAASDMWW